MMKNLYVFLDIDGVLNKKSEWGRPYTLNGECIRCFCEFINAMARKYTVKIILTSTWRGGFDESGNHLPQVQALVDKLKVHNIAISGKTPKSSDDDRLREIKYYLSRNASVTDAYIILDDDKSLFKDMTDSNIYFTDCVNGFMDSDRNKLLNRFRKG